MGGILEKRLMKRAADRWGELAARADTINAAEIQTLRRHARSLRRKLDLFECGSEAALIADPQADILSPDQCDWAWRPEPWATPQRPAGATEVPSPHQLSDSVTLFHDCARSEITLRQQRTTDPTVAAPYGMSMDVYRFDGSYLSLVLTLPEEAIAGLTRGHYFSLRLRVEREQPIEIYARLNIQHGPNTEQMVRQIDFREDSGLAEFDLAYSKINEKRIEKAWIDLIFESPAMNQVTLADLTLTRAPRADL